MATQVAIGDLNTWLGSQPENTVDTPYEIQITGLTSSNVPDIKTALTANPTKYVDLTMTSVPAVNNKHEETFKDCTSLVCSPSLANADNCYKTFYGCTNLKEIKRVPTPLSDNYIDTEDMYRNCTSLVDLRGVHLEQVRYAQRMFMGCTSLRFATVLGLYGEGIEVADKQSMFEGCTSLEYVSPIKSCPSFVYQDTGNCNNMFEGCTSLTSVNIKDSGAFYMRDTFKSCTSLEVPPVLPSTVTDLSHCFEGCTNLKQRATFSVGVSMYSGNVINGWGDTVYNSYYGTKNNSVGTVTVAHTYTGQGFEQTVDEWSYANYCCLVKGNTNNVVYIAIQAQGILHAPSTVFLIPLDKMLLDENANFYISDFENYYDGTYWSEVSGILNNVWRDSSHTVEISKQEYKTLSVGTTYYLDSGRTKSTPNDSFTVLYNNLTIQSALNVNIMYNLEIPSSVGALNSTFKNCFELDLVPNIPNGVTTLESAFENCVKSKAEEVGVTVTGISIWNAESRNGSYHKTTKYKDWASSLEKSFSGEDFAHDEYKGCTLSNNVTIKQEINILDPYYENDFNFTAIQIVKNLGNNKYYLYQGWEAPYYTPRFHQTLTELEGVTLKIDGTVGIQFALMFDNIYPEGAVYTDSTMTESGYFGGDIGHTCYYGGVGALTEFVGTYETVSAPIVLCTTEGIDYTKKIVLPNSVTDMDNTFKNCANIEYITNIPSSVTSMESTFEGCSKLQKIGTLGVSLQTFIDNEYFHNTFKDCPLLSQIGYKINESDWHVWKLYFDSDTVSGKIFDKNGDSVNITSHQVSDTGSNPLLIMPVLTDELWFPDEETSAQIDTLIGKMITYKYGVFNRETIPPDEKTMVLWADDKNHFKTNIEMGGDIPVYATQALAEADLPNLAEGTIIATEIGGDGVVDQVVSGDMSAVTSNAVYKCFEYTTTEVNTGLKWIDGKDRYLKVINIGSLPNAGTKNINHNISNLYEVIRIQGFAHNNDRTDNIPLPWVDKNVSAEYNVSVRVKSTQITLETNGWMSSYSGYVILEYTKTT